MGRKKWNKSTDKEKKKIWEKIQNRINNVTELREGYQENLDVFDAVNDKIGDYFECDMDCSTCNCEDRAKCMQGFKLANIFLLKKNRMLLEMYEEYIEGISDVLHGAASIIEELVTEKDEKKTKKKEIEKAGYFT